MPLSFELAATVLRVLFDPKLLFDISELYYKPEQDVDFMLLRFPLLFASGIDRITLRQNGPRAFSRKKLLIDNIGPEITPVLSAPIILRKLHDRL